MAAGTNAQQSDILTVFVVHAEDCNRLQTFLCVHINIQFMRDEL